MQKEEHPIVREERSVTLALLDLCAAITKSGATDEPLKIIGECLVRHIEAIQFAFYCKRTDDVGVVAAVRDGVDVYKPSPDIRRRIVAELRRVTRCGEVVEIEPQMTSAFFPEELRDKGTSYRGLAFDVVIAGRSEAVFVAYMNPEFVVTPRHRAWFTVFRDTTVALMSHRAALTQVESERGEALEMRRYLSLKMEADRTRVRDHLATILKARTDYRAGARSLRDAVDDIETSARSLVAVSDDLTRDDLPERVEFLDPALEKWVEKGLASKRIKALLGVRGTNKTTILHAVRNKLLLSGVDAGRVVLIDFEDARFRHFKSSDDLLDYLGAFTQSRQVNYLFLDEVEFVGWQAEFLQRMKDNPRWNVWLAASAVPQAGADAERVQALDLLVYRSWTAPEKPCPRAELERTWCQIFLRDVVSGTETQDIRAKEMLAEYFSDHLGEMKSLREISKEMPSAKRLSAMTVRTYRQALIDAHLIEVSPVYDAFENSMVASLPGRVFYTDLELRAYRFGPAPTDDTKRLELNRLYLQLRRDYEVVYTPRDGSADFLTLSRDGKPLLWKIPARESSVWIGTDGTPERVASSRSRT